MLYLYSIHLLKCFCSIVKLLILCSLVFVNVSEKIYFKLSHKNIHYYLKLQFSQNRDYNQTHCNDRRNTFHFACRQWYSYNNPHF